MGIYDTVGKEGLQIKCIGHLELTMKHYNVRDSISLNDGLYICYGGWFVVRNQKVLCTGKRIFSKYGDEIDGDNIISELNPVSVRIKSHR